MTEVALVQNDAAESAKRNQILDGAKACFLAQGFDGASMNDIVKAAGVSKGTVYAYFPSKDKLFEALIFRDRRLQAEQTMVIENPERPVQEVLYDLALRFGRLHKTRETIAYVRLVVAVAEKFPQIGKAFYEAGPAFAYDKVADYLQSKMDDGTLQQANPHLAATQFLELVMCGQIKPKLFAAEDIAPHYPLEEVVRSGVAMFLAGMKKL
ncbi:MAG: TetR/AcrR family transcriptional regulator [Alphaproteobacteria bacterium]|nr:TetR/AcrR family transcriptional regulator [Alphaproteobacteria bacterium]